MGYYAHTERDDLRIKGANFGNIMKQFDLEGVNDIADLFDDYGFGIYIDHDGDIVEAYYEHEKIDTDDIEEFLNKIAPYVEAESVLSFCGEDDARWAYYFDGTTMEEYYGDTYYPGMPGEGNLLHGSLSVKHTLSAIFGAERLEKISPHIIAQMEEAQEKSHSGLSAVCDVLFSMIADNEADFSPIAELDAVLAG